MIRLKNVSWRRKDKWILENISWHIQPNEHWCLFGLNGSGKTTLLNIITGYIWPTKGEVSVLGKKFGQVDLRELRKEIGWVSSSLQEKITMRSTALQTVLSGKFATIGLYDPIEQSDQDQALSVMEQLDCATIAEQPYQTLSQGEKQRVLIARALMAEPKLLILDEPCTGLDVISRERLLTQIDRLANLETGPTLVYVTHHVEEILPCFRQSLLIKNGQLFSSGNTSAEFSSENMSEFLQYPARIEKKNNRMYLSLNM